jgi:signal transduction histidine kinase
MASAEYRNLQELDRSRNELLALHAEIDVLRQTTDSRLHDARAIVGAMSAALHALERAGGTPAIAAAIGDEIGRLRQILTAAPPAALTRIPAGVICQSVESFARLRDVPLTVHVGRDAILLVEPTGIIQILRNLVDNARKYAPGSEVRITSEPAGPYVRINIDDDGPGIDVTLAEALFQSGVRSGGSEQGSGRGLADARRLAEAMQGSLWYEPRPEGGSRFVLKLRRAESPDSLHPAEERR